MFTSRLNKTRTTVSLAAAALAATVGLVGCSDEQSSAEAAVASPALNRMEHEPHRQLVARPVDDARAVNPHEHENRRLGDGQGIAPAPSNSADPCTPAFERAWQWLGHFSDGYESYLLRQPTCGSTPAAAGGR